MLINRRDFGRLLAGSALASGALADIKVSPEGRQKVIWIEPKPWTVDDWKWGWAGQEYAPVPPFQFRKEDTGGTTPKIKLTDSKGRKYIAKWGAESFPDTFGPRFASACGYLSQPTYWVAEGKINGVQGLTRTKQYVNSDGAFQNARFKIEDNPLEYVEGMNWSWTNNPFLGTPQLNGLRVLMMLLSNWDTKDSRNSGGGNTAVFIDMRDQNNSPLIYAFNDWGASMGKWGGFFHRDKWNAASFVEESQNFVKGSAKGEIDWGFTGKHTPDIVKGITIADLQWILQYLSRFTDDQLQAGLLSCGASQDEAQQYTQALRGRITQIRWTVEAYAK